jgi:serine/threonine-protein kinase
VTPGRDDDTQVSRPMPIRAGQRVAGRYDVKALLGRGGMGAVFAVQDLVLDEAVALKVLDLRDVDDPPTAVDRFRREVRLARRVTHRNVCRTFDLGEQDGLHFLTMEWVQGESLHATLTREGRLPPGRAAWVALEAARGLAAAHRAGVVHRDLKPGNVLLGSDGRVVLTDFGVSRSILGGERDVTQGLAGTPDYMAPEQLTGALVDGRADLYALGVVLFEMLTGRRAFEGPTPLVAAFARLSAPPPDPRSLEALPDDLALLVISCLALDPERRPASAEEIGRALEPFAGAAPELQEREASPASRISATRDLGPAASFAAPASDARTLAVLPFRWRGPPEGAHLAEGLSDELLDTLSMTRSLRVMGRGAVARFQDTPDPRTLGRELAVDAVVDGSVSAAGAELLVAVRLVEVSTGVQLWHESWRGPLSDVLALEGRMALRIAEALRIRVASLAVVGAPAEAIDLYFRGRRALALLHQDPAAPGGALDLLTRCLELAPDLRPAIAAHATTVLRAWFFPRAADSRDWSLLAKGSVARAEACASEHAETHLASAMLQMESGDYGAAADSVRRSLEIAPTCAAAHEYLGERLCEAGDSERGLAHLRLAVDLDPSLTFGWLAIARCHALAGDAAAATGALEQASRRAASASLPLLGHRLRLAGWSRDAASVAALVAAFDGMGDPFSGLFRVMGAVFLGEASPESLEVALDVMSPLVTNRRLLTLLCQISAEVHCAAGATELGWHRFLRAVDARLVDLEWVDRCPLLAPLRTLADFEPARRRVAARAEALRLG